jgi:hypothetical protein
VSFVSFTSLERSIATIPRWHGMKNSHSLHCSSVCKKLGHYFFIVVVRQLACNICMWIYLVHNYIAILAFWCIRFTTLIKAILVKVYKNDALRFCLTCLDEKLKLNISKIGDGGWALGGDGWKSNVFGELNHDIQTWTLNQQINPNPKPSPKP